MIHNLRQWSQKLMKYKNGGVDFGFMKDKRNH